MLEIKDGTLPPSRRALNLAEQAFRAKWGDAYHVVLSEEDALRAVGVLRSVTIREE